MRPLKYKKQKVPNFILKLYSMLNDEKSQSIIEWTPTKDAFIILDLNEFTQTILPQYFKHSNYSSFIRQLNMYSFAKKRQDGIVGTQEHIYFNKNFLYDNETKLKQIKRKENGQNRSLAIHQKQRNDEGSLDIESECFNDQPKSSIQELQWKIENIKSKQEKLRNLVYHMIQQNQVLISQNKELSLKYKRDARKKDRILDQVFQIVGASITQFWNDLCDDGEILEDRSENLQELYRLLVQFINQNDIGFIFQTLDLFLMKNDEKKVKIFNVMTQDEEQLFRSLNEEEISDLAAAVLQVEKQIQ